MKIVAALLLLGSAAQETRKEYFASPAGNRENAGSKDSPWDLATALARPLEPGSTLWVQGGTYQGKFEIKLAGREGAPIVVRAVPGARATILDCGLKVLEPSAYLWLQDLEIAGSVPVEKRRTEQKGSWPSDLPGSDGLQVHAGKGCKFINLLIHDNVGNGVSWWVGSTDSEFYGCIIYGNGWVGPDRGHGHCIYTQNKEGVKTISNCILTVPFEGSYTMHAYGSGKAYVDNYVLEENIAFRRGTFLVGGGRPSNRIAVRRNCLHGVGLQIGYSAPENEDCEVRDNVIAAGKISINKYKKVVDEGNVRDLAEPRSVLFPNRYDPNRAHVAVYNPAKGPESRLNVAAFLKMGDGFKVMDALDLYGKPVLEGTCGGESITVPMKGEFAALVIFRSPKK